MGQPQIMNSDSTYAGRPILIIPYVWIGDFVRCHSVVKLLRAEAPERPVDVVSSTLCAPLADYMPGVQRAIVADLPRGRLGLPLNGNSRTCCAKPVMGKRS
jgi:heptosyltransferase II